MCALLALRTAALRGALGQRQRGAAAAGAEMQQVLPHQRFEQGVSDLCE